MYYSLDGILTCRDLSPVGCAEVRHASKRRQGHTNRTCGLPKRPHVPLLLGAYTMALYTSAFGVYNTALCTSTWGPQPPWALQLGPYVPQLGPHVPPHGSSKLMQAYGQHRSTSLCNFCMVD